MRKLLLIIGLFLPSAAFASTVTAATCSIADINTAITSAGRNGTVIVLGGSCTWSGSLTITKGITLTGAGSSSTLITSSGGITFVNGSPDATAIANGELIRITGFSFNGNNASGIFFNLGGASGITGTKPFCCYAIGNNTFKNQAAGTSNGVITAANANNDGQLRGVIYSNLFDRTDITMRVFSDNDTREWANTAFNNLAFGTSDNLFFESNTIQCSTSFGGGDSGWSEVGQGGRLVMRYNTYNMSNCGTMTEFNDVHGFQNWNGTVNSGQTGSMIDERYGNTYTNIAQFRAQNMRGGIDLMFDNIFTGSTSPSLDIYGQSSGASCPSDINPAPTNYNPLMQLAYLWNNTMNGTNKTAGLAYGGTLGCTVTQNNGAALGSLGASSQGGWWNQNAACTSSACTAGIGQGTTAPTGTCTKGTAYWVASTPGATTNPSVIQNAALYQCTATNTWTNFYTPYTFPHPLTFTSNTWYIRTDGGTRWSANATSGQCNGLADVAYPGSGTNQACAFNDFRWLYDDQTFAGTMHWVIAGGDTVIIRGCASGPTSTAPDCRIGSDTQTAAGSGWCPGVGNAGCFNPAIPAGTAGQHTRILGQNFAACSTGTPGTPSYTVDKTKLTQLFGGWGVGLALNLTSTSYVDIQCIQLWRHSQCIFFGSPAVPAPCNRSFPSEDDYADSGIATNASTHDVFLTDIWDHGFLSRGVIGPIGGLVQCTRCNIDSNGGAGWDFDDGSATPMGAGALWVFNYSIIQWSGCNQEYPFVDAIPVTSCYSQGTGGYGDGVGSPAGTGFSVTADHSSFVYNTQDGIDLGHVDTGGPYTLHITNSFSAHNGGSNGFKWDDRFGSVADPVIVTGNLVLGDCSRMSAPITGAPNTYNVNLSDFCRAGDNWPFNFNTATVDIVANNTAIGYASTFFDWSCNAAGPSPCPSAVLKLYNNITLGYANLGAPCGPCAPGFANNPGSNYGGTNAGPGMINLQNGGPGITDFQNDLCFQIRSSCPSTGFTNSSPLLAGMPSGNGVTFVEGELDVFGTTIPVQSAWKLAGGSPGLAAGITYAQLPSVDLFGTAASSPPVIGGINPTGAIIPPMATFSGTIKWSGSVKIP